MSQIITGVQNASQNESVLSGGVNRFPTNGIRAQVSAANRYSNSPNRNETEEQSVVIYDHLLSFFLSFGLATEVPKLTHYGVVWFHLRA